MEAVEVSGSTAALLPADSDVELRDILVALWLLVKALLVLQHLGLLKAPSASGWATWARNAAARLVTSMQPRRKGASLGYPVNLAYDAQLQRWVESGQDAAADQVTSSAPPLRTSHEGSAAEHLWKRGKGIRSRYVDVFVNPMTEQQASQAASSPISSQAPSADSCIFYLPHPPEAAMPVSGAPSVNAGDQQLQPALQEGSVTLCGSTSPHTMTLKAVKLLADDGHLPDVRSPKDKVHRGRRSLSNADSELRQCASPARSPPTTASFTNTLHNAHMPNSPSQLHAPSLSLTDAGLMSSDAAVPSSPEPEPAVVLPDAVPGTVTTVPEPEALEVADAFPAVTTVDTASVVDCEPSLTGLMDHVMGVDGEEPAEQGTAGLDAALQMVAAGAAPQCAAPAPYLAALAPDPHGAHQVPATVFDRFPAPAHEADGCGYVCIQMGGSGTAAAPECAEALSLSIDPGQDAEQVEGGSDLQGGASWAISLQASQGEETWFDQQDCQELQSSSMGLLGAEAVSEVPQAPFSFQLAVEGSEEQPSELHSSGEGICALQASSEVAALQQDGHAADAMPPADEQPAIIPLTDEQCFFATPADEQPAIALLADEQCSIATLADEQPAIALLADEQCSIATPADEQPATALLADEQCSIATPADEQPATVLLADEQCSIATPADEQPATVLLADEQCFVATLADEQPATALLADEQCSIATPADEQPATALLADEQCFVATLADEQPAIALLEDEQPAIALPADEQYNAVQPADGQCSAVPPANERCSVMPSADEQCSAQLADPAAKGCEEGAASHRTACEAGAVLQGVIPGPEAAVTSVDGDQEAGQANTAALEELCQPGATPEANVLGPAASPTQPVFDSAAASGSAELRTQHEQAACVAEQAQQEAQQGCSLPPSLPQPCSPIVLLANSEKPSLYEQPCTPPLPLSYVPASPLEVAPSGSSPAQALCQTTDALRMPLVGTVELDEQAPAVCAEESAGSAPGAGMQSAGLVCQWTLPVPEQLRAVQGPFDGPRHLALPPRSPLPLQLTLQVDRISSELAAIDTCLTRAAAGRSRTQPPTPTAAGPPFASGYARAASDVFGLVPCAGLDPVTPVPVGLMRSSWGGFASSDASVPAGSRTDGPSLPWHPDVPDEQRSLQRRSCEDKMWLQAHAAAVAMTPEAIKGWPRLALGPGAELSATASAGSTRLPGAADATPLAVLLVPPPPEQPDGRCTYLNLLYDWDGDAEEDEGGQGTNAEGRGLRSLASGSMEAPMDMDSEAGRSSLRHTLSEQMVGGRVDGGEVQEVQQLVDVMLGVVGDDATLAPAPGACRGRVFGGVGVERLAFGSPVLPNQAMGAAAAAASCKPPQNVRDAGSPLIASSGLNNGIYVTAGAADDSSTSCPGVPVGTPIPAQARQTAGMRPALCVLVGTPNLEWTPPSPPTPVTAALVGGVLAEEASAQRGSSPSSARQLILQLLHSGTCTTAVSPPPGKAGPPTSDARSHALRLCVDDSSGGPVHCHRSPSAMPPSSPSPGTPDQAALFAAAAAGAAAGGLQPQQLILRLFEADSQHVQAATAVCEAAARVAGDMCEEVVEGVIGEVVDKAVGQVAEEVVRAIDGAAEAAAGRACLGLGDSPEAVEEQAGEPREGSVDCGQASVGAGYFKQPFIMPALGVQVADVDRQQGVEAAGSLETGPVAPDADSSDVGSERASASEQPPSLWSSGGIQPAECDSPQLRGARRSSRSSYLRADARVPVFRSQDELHGYSVLLGPNQTAGACYLAESQLLLGPSQPGASYLAYADGQAPPSQGRAHAQQGDGELTAAAQPAPTFSVGLFDGVSGSVSFDASFKTRYALPPVVLSPSHPFASPSTSAMHPTAPGSGALDGVGSQSRLLECSSGDEGRQELWLGAAAVEASLDLGGTSVLLHSEQKGMCALDDATAGHGTFSCFHNDDVTRAVDAATGGCKLPTEVAGEQLLRCPSSAFGPVALGVGVSGLQVCVEEGAEGMAVLPAPATVASGEGEEVRRDDKNECGGQPETAGGSSHHLSAAPAPRISPDVLDWSSCRFQAGSAAAPSLQLLTGCSGTGGEGAAMAGAAAVLGAPAAVGVTPPVACMHASPSLLAWSDWPATAVHQGKVEGAEVTPMEEWTGWQGVGACAEGTLGRWGHTISRWGQQERVSQAAQVTGGALVKQQGVHQEELLSKQQALDQGVTGAAALAESFPVQPADLREAAGTPVREGAPGDGATAEELQAVQAAVPEAEVARVLDFGAAGTSPMPKTRKCWEGEQQQAEQRGAPHQALGRDDQAASAATTPRALPVQPSVGDGAETAVSQGFRGEHSDGGDQLLQVRSSPASDHPLASIRPLYSFMTPSQGWAGNGFAVRSKRAAGDEVEEVGQASGGRQQQEGAAAGALLNGPSELEGQVGAQGQGTDVPWQGYGHERTGAVSPWDGRQGEALGSPWRRAAAAADGGQDGQAPSRRHTSPRVSARMREAVVTAAAWQLDPQGQGVGPAGGGQQTGSRAPLAAARGLGGRGGWRQADSSTPPMLLPSYVRSTVMEARVSGGGPAADHADAEASGLMAAGAQLGQGLPQPGWRSIVKSWRSKIAAGARSAGKVSSGGIGSERGGGTPPTMAVHARGTPPLPRSADARASAAGGGAGCSGGLGCSPSVGAFTPISQRLAAGVPSGAVTPSSTGASARRATGSDSPWDTIINEYNRASGGSRRSTK